MIIPNQEEKGSCHECRNVVLAYEGAKTVYEKKRRNRKARENIFAKEAEELLGKERKHQDKNMQRLEEEMMVNHRECFGDIVPWDFDGPIQRQPKRPSMRLTSRECNRV